MTISRGTAFDAECLIRVFHRRLRDKKYPQGHVAGLIEGQPTSAQASFVAQRFILIESSAIALASSIFGPRADRLTVHLIEAFETSWFATRKPEGNRFNVVVRLADQPD